MEIRELKLSRRSGLRAILYLQQPLPRLAQRIILPARIFSATRGSMNHESLRLHSLASRQAKNLVRKVEMLSNVLPGGRTYSADFAAGRLLVVRSQSVAEERAWEFAGSVIGEAEQRLGLRVLAQPDYDQKMYQHTFASYYDAIPLQVIHDPTARGTVLAFAAACRVAGVQFSNARFGILGMGNLGSRIASMLSKRHVSRIIICDQDSSRLSQYSRRKGYQIAESFTELCEATPDALILCGHSASLSRGSANVLVRQRTIRIVGGPEAGLDHSIGALRVLDRAGLDFVPSMLCGALGLAATLEESLGERPRLRAMEARFARFLDSVVQDARICGTRFHHAFRDIVSSRLGTRE